jgi:hypothetical protein
MNYAQMKNAPAFPVSFKWGRELSQYNGMTLRDYFAAKAMQGLYSDPEWRIDMDFSDTAYAAYNQADAMMKAREA